jgi:hypothetical protein
MEGSIFASCAERRAWVQCSRRRDHRRLSIHARDRREVFAEEAKLLTMYGEQIARSVENIIAKYPEPEGSNAAATAYIAAIGSNIPDETIKAAVRRLAIVKFRLRGVLQTTFEVSA